MINYGTKINNLCRMVQEKIPVPPFIIVEWDKLQFEAESFDKSNSFKLTKNTIPKISQMLRNKMKALTFSYDLKSISSATFFAVRSACFNEDDEECSFAGQFDTYLNVRCEELDTYICKCFQSLYTENVLEYCLLHQIDYRNLKMNIMIQEMVDAKISGVLFTANPQGILNEMVIVVGRGLGEGLESDDTDTTTYYYHVTDQVFYYEGKENLIDADTIKELVLLSKEISRIFGSLLDIEFAINEGHIWILQARKITTISAKHPLICDNSNIVQSYPGITLPLTASFVETVYEGVLRSIAEKLLKNREEINQYEEVFENIVGTVNGRLYYKISNFSTLIRILPYQNQIIPIWQEFLGMSEMSDSMDKKKFHQLSRLKLYFIILNELILVQRKMKRLSKTFDQVKECVDEQLKKNLTNEEIVDLIELVKEKLLYQWDITLINDMYTFIFNSLLQNKLRESGVSESEQLANRYISDLTIMESMKPVRELIRLTNLAIEENVIDHFDAPKQKFSKAFDQFIFEYGDRSMDELKLESETFRTNPELVYEKIREFAANEEERTAMMENLQKIQPFKVKGGIGLRFVLRHAGKGIKSRETSNLNRAKSYGIIRKLILILAKRFQSIGIIEQERDIFYLTMEEVCEAARGEKADYRNRIILRKKEYKLYKRLPEYSRLIFTSKEFNKSHALINSIQLFEEESILYGTPCSEGMIEGEVLVVHNLNEAKNVKNKILVTVISNPSFVFLLTQAKGIITEKGSLLSHAAIISRELKKPSIVGVWKACSLLCNGDYIRMDGNTGCIEVLKKSSHS